MQISQVQRLRWYVLFHMCVCLNQWHLTMCVIVLTIVCNTMQERNMEDRLRKTLVECRCRGEFSFGTIYVHIYIYIMFSAMNMYLRMYLLQCRSRTQSQLNNLWFVFYLLASGCEQTTVGLTNRMQISLVQWVKVVEIWCVFNISHKMFRYCY